MIAELRRLHRAVFLLLFPGLLVLYGASLYFRRDMPLIMSELPATLHTKRPQGKTLLLSKKIMTLGEASVIVRTWNLSEEYWVSLHTEENPWSEPDLLLYFQTAKTEDLSANAYLLGTLTDKQKVWFALPPNYIPSQGYFVLYSLAHSQVLSVFQPQGKVL